MGDLFLILTAEEADAVRGPTAPGAMLAPLPLADGVTFVLPADVLDDPAHEIRHAELAALPMREVAPEEWPPPPDI